MNLETGNDSQPKPQAEPEFLIDPPTPPDASSDEKAESEAAALAFDLPLGDVKTEKKISKLKSQQRIYGSISFCLSALIVLAAALLGISFCVLFYHFLVPEGWLFLSAERIGELREFLLSSTFGAGIAALWAALREKED